MSLQVISNIFLVLAHTETKQPSRSKQKHKVKAREMSSEANHKETQGFISRSESYVSVEELVGLESLATRSLELGLFSTTPPFHQGGKITPA